MTTQILESNIDFDKHFSLPPLWENLLAKELQSTYFQNIKAFLKNEINNGKVICPSIENIFNAFRFCEFENLKVVLLGQDPYHSLLDSVLESSTNKTPIIPIAMGLSFSVIKEAKIPPSLKNIYKEIAISTNATMPTHGNLSNWAKQGVLLLNAILSVEAHKCTAHKSIGWEKFSNSVIANISAHKKNIVFILLGNFAKKKKSLIDSSRHCILEAPHPSPLARNFIGSGVFIKANEYLQKHNIAPINWAAL